MQQQPPPPLSANGVVESLMESFCQCFGTESPASTSQRLVDDDDVLAQPSTPPRNSKEGDTPSTPERKEKRQPINRLFKLQQKGKDQWNSFFFGQQPAPTTPQDSSRKHDNHNTTNLVTPQPLQPEFTSSTVTATSRRNRSTSKSNGFGNRNTSMTSIERKSRSSSKSSSPKSQQNRDGTTKRKRVASRDDIFRSKRDQHPPHNMQHNSLQFKSTSTQNGANNSNQNMNPFLSRFLSGSSPVCMATLCFATPIRGDSSFEDNELNNNTIGDDEDEYDAASSSKNNDSNANGRNSSSNNNNSGNHNDVASVVSDSNTLNTAEDTITSTLYYETTKLAGLKQTNPLMPLYNSHAVGDAKDDIHQIVQNQNNAAQRLQQPLILLSNHQIPRQQYVPSIPPPQQVLQENNMDDEDDDEDDSVGEQIYSNYESQTNKQQPITPTKKVPPQYGSAVHQHHYSPVRIIAAGSKHHSNVIMSTATTPNQSPLPPVSKLSSDSSKS